MSADFKRILLAEDERSLAWLISEELAAHGYRTVIAGNGAEALELLRASVGAFDMILSDVVMPRMTGIELLRAVRREQATMRIPVVLMSAVERSADAALAAEELGADDYLLKPLKPGEAAFTVERLTRTRAPRGRPARPNSRQEELPAARIIVGQSAPIQRLLKLIQSVAPTEATVLITGETGTGKELVARAIHDGSARRHGRFVTINCGAIPEALLEAELFGAERGAYTGATDRRQGRLEHANGGTIFLDEIGELPLSMQPKLLRVLQERQFERLGSNETVRLDARIIAATNMDLVKSVEAKVFRQDLFYRLNVISLHMPPLRERREDIPLVVEHFLAALRQKTGKQVTSCTPEAMSLLMSYAWPGNVRELEHALEGVVILADGPELRADDLSPRLSPPCEKGACEKGEGEPEAGLEIALASFERRFLERSLSQHQGQIRATAIACGVAERTLHRKMKQYGLSRNKYR